MAQRGTTTQNNLRVGSNPGYSSARTIGSVVLHQRAEIGTVPLSGSQVFVLPSSAEISRFDIVMAAALGAEAVVRFGAVGAGGSNFYGSTTVSGAGVYNIATPSTVGTVWTIGASSQPIGISVVSGSGLITPLNGNITARVYYTRKYEKFDT
jgi:hypothetical protein